MTASTEVRRYQPEDYEELLAIFTGSVREVASADYTPEQISAWINIDRHSFAQRCLRLATFVAVIDDVIVGFTNYQQNGYLDMLYVHPYHQRTGIAALLVATVEAAVVQNRIPRLFTDASITARPFFERMGFHVLVQQQVSRHGQLLTNFQMEKMI